MLRSMTGFGATSGVVDGIEYSVEVRSVNNRYYKAAIKLPESWGEIESQIESLLRTKVTRGTVTLTVRMKVPDDQAACRVNTAALQSYVDQLRTMEVDANPTMRIDLGSLLLLPGVCSPPPLEELAERSGEGLMKLVAKAVDDMMKMRSREGETTRADLTANCSVIRQNLEAVAKLAPGVVKDYHERLVARVNELTASAQIHIDAESLAREVAIFADRCDINEEITRLRAHLDQFMASMDSPEPAGRKMDFIAQEMLREANTIASKASDAEIARAVVDIKTAVDRIKEQAANAE